MDNGLSANNHVKSGIDVEVEIMQPPMHSPSPAGPTCTSSTTKGYGLKKWRRIKRDFVKDPSAANSISMEASKMLKRGLSSSSSSSANKPQPKTSPEAEIENNIDLVGQVSNGKGNGNGLMMQTPCLDVTDSDLNLSAKSMTLPFGYVHQKSQMHLGNSNQRIQQGKGGSKKHRGERVKIDKQNNHSSLESDSTNSNFVFMERLFSSTSNEKSMSYVGEIKKQNSSEIEPPNLAADEDKSGNCRPSPDQHPLLHSILALQSIQEALENEVQKFGEIGKEPTFLHDDSFNTNGAPVGAYQEFHESSSSDQLASERMRKGTSGSFENQVFTLTQKVKYLESKLEEARAVLQVRESRMLELETKVNTSRSLHEESGSTVRLQQDKYREMEFNLEGLFQQKMEAEIEFLALTMALKKSGVSVDNQIRLCEEQTSSSGEEAEMLSKLIHPESNAAMLKKQALEKYRGDVLGTVEILKIQRRVCKVTSCFFTQLVFLFLVLWLVVLQLLPHWHSRLVVPT